MAHQCLKCGHAYPDGSPQILKGCEECKGTRFFYTDRPLDDAARAEVAERTEVDLERIALGKGTSKPASKPAAPRRIPTKDELPLGSDKDWVELGPNYLRNVVEDVVRRAGERKPVFRVGAQPPADKPTLAQWIRERGGTADTGDDGDQGPDGPAADAPDADDLLDDLVRPERETEWREASHDVDAPSAPAGPPDAESAPVDPDEVVYQRGPRRVPRPVSLAGVAVDASEDAELREKAREMRERIEAEAEALARDPAPAPAEAESLYPEGQRPETVGISAPGVYELDVKRLMEKSPIVVHKDGTYSLHLPSLMESVDKRKHRR